MRDANPRPRNPPMTVGPVAPVLRFIRRIARVADPPDWADGELLDRFFAARDENAFARIVQRYGPMVFGVCRRILGNVHDADDAFQATFLVLASKTGGIDHPELLGNWLYGVACRVSARAKTRAARRTTHERQAALPSTLQDAEPDDVRPLLDEELQQLPAKYRDPLVLCYLEGRTYEEAARRLGWQLGTVAGRLARARDLLRERLTRRGVTLCAAGLAAALGREATAAVPVELAMVTVGVATQFAAGGTVSDRLVELVEGVTDTMLQK